MAELIQKKLQGEVEKYQQLQKDLSKSMSGRQKLEAQLTENNIVKEELALLDGSNVVFKLLGPVLVKQELGEARATVGKRLDYITAEIDTNPSSETLNDSLSNRGRPLLSYNRSFNGLRQQRQGLLERPDPMAGGKGTGGNEAALGSIVL
ncbi:prefoldin subunit 6 [Marmota monax]|uniref:Prefoldin subunit 6 n=1 Tax=Marmota monax TaxID=9995 RepID=A0A834QB07_MARMO|nr:prefoldin subunit 6 [Marmota monax]